MKLGPKPGRNTAVHNCTGDVHAHDAKSIVCGKFPASCTSYSSFFGLSSFLQEEIGQNVLMCDISNAGTLHCSFCMEHLSWQPSLHLSTPDNSEQSPREQPGPATPMAESSPFSGGMEDTEKTGAAPGTRLSLAGPVGGPRTRIITRPSRCGPAAAAARFK